MKPYARKICISLLLLLSGCGDQEFSKEVATMHKECKGTKTVEVQIGTFWRSLTVRCQETP
jgi:hypothetical protein